MGGVAESCGQRMRVFSIRLLGRSWGVQGRWVKRGALAHAHDVTRVFMFGRGALVGGRVVVWAVLGLRVEKCLMGVRVRRGWV